MQQFHVGKACSTRRRQMICSPIVEQYEAVSDTRAFTLCFDFHGISGGIGGWVKKKKEINKDLMRSANLKN